MTTSLGRESKIAIVSKCGEDVVYCILPLSRVDFFLVLEDSITSPQICVSFTNTMVRAHSRKLCVSAELNEEGYSNLCDIICTTWDCSVLLMGVISQNSHMS